MVASPPKADKSMENPFRGLFETKKPTPENGPYRSGPTPEDKKRYSKSNEMSVRSRLRLILNTLHAHEDGSATTITQDDRVFVDRFFNAYDHSHKDPGGRTEGFELTNEQARDIVRLIHHNDLYLLLGNRH